MSVVDGVYQETSSGTLESARMESSRRYEGSYALILRAERF